jgi:hypothetical protein
MRYLLTFENMRWGTIGAGIVPYCKETNKFLVGLRSDYVLESDTWVSLVENLI